MWANTNLDYYSKVQVPAAPGASAAVCPRPRYPRFDECRRRRPLVAELMSQVTATFPMSVFEAVISWRSWTALMGQGIPGDRRNSGWFRIANRQYRKDLPTGRASRNPKPP
jgi:hypothetical protein